ncbi:MAG: hypothetical protein ABMA01_06660, partial [Chthoniobacteraceae bacterium]
MAELIAELEASLAKCNHDYRIAFASFLDARPGLSRWNALSEEYRDMFRKELNSPANSELLRWIVGKNTDSPEELAKRDGRRNEVARLRQFLFLGELNSLLQDSEASGFVSPWLATRIQALTSKLPDYEHGAAASNWS